MIELALFLGLLGGLLLLAFFFKVVLAIVFWPLKALFWVLGGLLTLVLLPFQFLGGLLFAVLFLPLLALGLVVMVGVGAPLLAILGIALAVWVVGGLVAIVGGLLLGGC
ncbi:hypothetical protein K8I85_07115 [bacterium]|nr:hypothetical protein [bacterium]